MRTSLAVLVVAAPAAASVLAILLLARARARARAAAARPPGTGAGDGQAQPKDEPEPLARAVLAVAPPAGLTTHGVPVAETAGAAAPAQPPCLPPVRLVAVVEPDPEPASPGADRSQEVRAAIEEGVVELIRADAVHVPPYPATVNRIRQVVARHDYGLDEVATLVAADPVLAADILRLANSAFHGRGAPVTSVTAAVARVGSQDVVRVALASALGPYARATGPLSALRRRAWLDSLAAAAICEQLARMRGLSPDEAFSCGLLHDFGKLVAVTSLEEVIGTRQAGPHPQAFWDALVERFHLELGLVSAARWNLPPLLSDAISAHHAETAEAGAATGLLGTVVAADAVVALLRERPRVTAAELAGSASLAPGEARAVEALVERLPAFLASLDEDAGEAAGGWSRSMVQPPRLTAVPLPEPLRLTATVGGQELGMAGEALAGAFLLARCARPLAPETLVPLDVRCPPPVFTLWAAVRASWPDGPGTHAVLLQPVALGAAALARWQTVVASPAPSVVAAG